MNSKIKFRLAARCEAAGRPNNEDNYQVDEDLSDDRWGFTADREIELGEKGALLLVCDGMGGMNAGEVASAIAVDTIKQHFETDQLTDSVLKNPTAYISRAIKDADAAIKRHCQEHPETEGMGSTIVLAWLLDGKVHVGWCGDSRCYCYNPKNGLVRLSHDHSYVQELVDAGKLTEELAFDHPNNNIITRSLGDPSGTARPDVKSYDLHDNDIIMLCSDGLCGCLRDNEIEEQISMHLDSMQECRDALWNADEAAGWHDNVTIAIAQIMSGAAAAVAHSEEVSDSKAELINANKRLKLILIIVIALLLVAGGGAAYYFLRPKGEPVEQPTTTAEEVKTENVEVAEQPEEAVKEEPAEPAVVNDEKKAEEKKTTLKKPKPADKPQTEQPSVDNQETSDANSNPFDSPNVVEPVISDGNKDGIVK